MKTSTGVSVIICCYNSVNRITTTLQYLECQNTSFNWELVIVNNNSTDNTERIIKDVLSKSDVLKSKTRLVNEGLSGLNYARQRGVKEAKHDFVLFCDDDNWLNKNYLQNAFNFLSTNESYGIAGGNGIEKCEINPPKWFDKHKSVYAIGCRKDGEVSNVYGAGMLLRKNLIENITLAMSGRKGKSLSSGDDSEICLIARNKGYKIRQLCHNTFFHYVPKERLTYSYIMRMAKASGKSKAELYLLERPKWKGVGYRLKTDVYLLISKLFKSDYFSFKYTFTRISSYWYARFIKA